MNENNEETVKPTIDEVVSDAIAPETQKDPSVEDGAMEKASEEPQTNAAGESNTHSESMSKDHGSEKRPEEGFNKVSDPDPSSPGTQTEGSIEKESEYSQNAAGESPTKAEFERKTEEEPQ
jgi:hypothetical protein